MLSSGNPPSVGTKMIKLLEPFMSCSTSIHCLVSASGESVWLRSRCCSVWRRATSTRWRSVSICCSWAILLLIACTTWGGGCRSRRKNAVTVAIRKLPPPARGLVTSAESTSPSIVFAICVRFEMSLIEYCTMPSRTPLRIALSTAPRIWSSLPISVKIFGACIGSICQRIDTSTCIPICSLERASMASICSPRVGHCSSRVEYRSLDDHGGAQQVGDGARALGAHRGGGQEKRNRDGQQGGAADELAHGISGEGPEKEDTASSVIRYPSSGRHGNYGRRRTDDGLLEQVRPL